MDTAIRSGRQTDRKKLQNKAAENKKASSVLKIDIRRGLSEKECAISRSLFGKNTLTKTKRHSFFRKFISNLNDPIIKILIGAMLFNILFMMKNINWPETAGIAAAIFIAAFVSTLSEHGSEKAFDKLNEASGKSSFTVIRDGIKREIAESELLTGDIILIGAGMMIPADCTVIKGCISVSQSALTGESADVKKCALTLSSSFYNIGQRPLSVSDPSCIFKGCLCTKGECEAVICNVGDLTEYGNIARELVSSSRPSPLKERLSELAKSVSFLGYIAAFMIMTAYLFNVFVIDSHWNTEVMLIRLGDLSFLVSSLLNAVTLGVSVIVVAVPEGLPMMITVVLSSNMKKMLKCGVLVRKPVGIETAGSMNILFTDKTGTLTTGNMKVKRMYTFGGEFSDPKKIASDAVFCEYIPVMKEHLIGSARKTPTEKAITDFFKSVRTNVLCTDISLTEKYPFNSDVKYSACLYSSPDGSKCALLGAAEKLVDASSSYISGNGTVKEIGQREKEHIRRIIKEETSACSRMLTLAIAPCESWNSVCRGNAEGLTFAALIAIKDELRHDIKSAVAEAKKAGVHVVMITGDNKDTACAIAKEAGISDSEKNIVLTGEEMSKMNDKELLRLLPSLAVVSRALPSDKKRLIDISRKAGLVSGMTGDGINDAPSLKAADVGFAMGSGSDVAKEAGDIIITNDSFSSITKAILYGRCVFESIRKFITFQLMMNFCALGVSLIGPFIGIESPITVIQMLWVNIIMDTLGGLAFAGEIPLSEYMKRPPITKSEKIMTKGMITQILFCGIYTLSLCIVFLKLPAIRSIIGCEDDTYFLTCFFALFIFCGIFNSFNARAPKGHLLSNLAGNKAFIFIIFFVMTVQLTMIYLGGEVFRTVPVTAKDLAITFLLSMSVIPADKIRKILFK